MEFWWRSLLKSKKDPEKDLSALTEALRSALGGRLKSIVVFGSMVRGGFDAKRSNVNVLVVAEMSFDALSAMRPALNSWLDTGHILPVLAAPDELDDFARDFPIEFLDMQEHHRVVFGSDPLAGFTVDKKHLRAQCEHDLALAQLRLRQAIAVAGGDTDKIRRALAASASSVAALSRAATRLEENAPKLDKIKTLEDLPASDVQNLAGRYLSSIESILIHLRK